MEIIGMGTYGEVKKAKHLLTEEFRAVKILFKKDFS